MSGKYGKIVDGKIKYAREMVRLGGKVIVRPTAEDYAALGFLPVVDEPPAVEYGYEARTDGSGEERDGKIYVRYEEAALPVTREDYDRVMEDYLVSVRSERGYTTREPDVYLNSSVERWAQDAKDWVAFRDTVMGYGLSVINTYAETGVAPTLREFKARLPKLRWTLD